MRLAPLIILLLTFFVATGQRMDTVEVSPTFTTVIEFESTLVGGVDIASKCYDVRPSGKVLLINVKPQYASGAPTTSLMAQTDSSVSVWIVRFAATPKKLHYKSSRKTRPVLHTESPRQTTSNYEETASVVSTIPDLTQAAEYITEAKKKNAHDYNTINTFPSAYKKKIDDILRAKQTFWDVAMKLNNLKFMLYHIHVDAKFMYFTFFIENNSSVSYTLDYLSIAHSPYTKGAKRVQAGNATELEATYMMTYKEALPDEQKLIVYAVPLMAFDDRDKILFKLSESSGNRTLFTEVSAKEITSAKRIK
ncbi:MAG: DUF4138 domain-containing protein [Cytophagales bacterium]|nr:DUF4138 domain-containing protein [Cytophagales bacterium]